MDMNLDAMYDDVRVDEENLGFEEEEVEEEVFSKFRNFGGFGLLDGCRLRSRLMLDFIIYR